mmetsp:Transcript_12154/g.22530  ORF Transcript_12154/g.22530 Transcript_12154/m.22530 type:complete len:381 (+) Transcript_12154:87-1229(+)
MGCVQSAPPPTKKMKFGRSPTKHNFGKDVNLKKEDYIYSKKGKEVLLKSPRDLNGQQFIVEECEGTDMFLIDHMGMLTVDYCQDCRIVAGPVASSVFIRNCENCVVVIACQQLRLRDCKNLTIFLHSTTGPIIESSSSISLGCYNYSYFGLESHLESAEMSIWENEWYSVYDFTPGGGGAHNHSLLPSGDPSTLITAVIPACSALVEDGLCATSSDDRVTPLLYGPLPASEQSALFVMKPEHAQGFRSALAPLVQRPAGEEVSDEAADKDKLVVLRTTKRLTSPAQLSTLVGGEKRLKAFTKAAKLNEVYAGVSLVAVEVSFAKSVDQTKGRALVEQLQTEMRRITESEGGEDTAKFLSWTGREADEKADMVFEHWRVQT